MICDPVTPRDLESSPQAQPSALLPCPPPQDVFSFYIGSVYSPSNDRIYFTPGLAYWNQPGNTAWEYLNCKTGKMVTYTGDYGDVAYWGGAYDPVKDRIYFAPVGPVAGKNLTCLQCKTGKTLAYQAAPVSMVDNPYAGAAYSPTQQRIYFAPSSQATATQWHYVDCTSGSLVAYSHGVGSSMTANAYRGAVHSPSQNRIYFVPADQASASQWHYIDCTAGTVGVYVADSMTRWTDISAAQTFGSQVHSMCKSPDSAALYVNSWVSSSSSMITRWAGTSWFSLGAIGGVATATIRSNGRVYIPFTDGSTTGVYVTQNTLYFDGSAAPLVTHDDPYEWPLGNGSTLHLTTTGTVPDGLAINTTYYVINWSSASETPTFQLSLDGFTPVIFTRSGTGVTTLWSDDYPDINPFRLKDISGTGFGNNSFFSSQAESFGWLYFGTQNEVDAGGAQLLKVNSAGYAWSQITTPWTSATVTEISGMAAHGGNFLYLTTMGPSGQPKLWKYADPTFTDITPWVAGSYSVTSMTYCLGNTYVCLSGATGAIVWRFDGVYWKQMPAPSTAWTSPGSYVIAVTDVRGYPNFSLSSTLDGTQMWRLHPTTWEKVVSFAYDFEAVDTFDYGTSGLSVFAGKNVDGAAKVMRNANQPAYPTSSAYYGAAYSPNQNRIYLAPNAATVDTSWQYIDCDTGSVLTFEHGMTSPKPCAFGSYSPIENRIYFGRFNDQEVPSAVTYVDCTTGAWSTLADSNFSSGDFSVIFSSNSNTMYFVPFLIPGETTVTIKVLTSDTISSLASSNPTYGKG